MSSQPRENLFENTEALLRLYNLHRGRCLGDVPDFRFKDYGLNLRDEETVEALGNILNNTGLSHYYDGGTLYAYNKPYLQELLDQNKEILIQAEWPTEADRFIVYMAHVTAPARTAIFDFIALCHGDHNNLWNNADKTEDAIKRQHEEAEKSKKQFRMWKPEFFEAKPAPAKPRTFAPRA